MKSKEYRDMKNYLHNELGMDRDFVLKRAQTYIEKSIDQHVVQMLDSAWVSNMINRKIGEVIDRKSVV